MGGSRHKQFQLPELQAGKQRSEKKARIVEGAQNLSGVDDQEAEVMVHGVSTQSFSQFIDLSERICLSCYGFCFMVSSL